MNGLQSTGSDQSRDSIAMKGVGFTFADNSKHFYQY